MKLSALSLIVVVVTFVLVSNTNVQEVESLPTLSKALTCARGLVETMKLRMINKSGLVDAFNARLEMAKQRYEASDLSNMDEEAKSNHYNLLVLEEIRSLKRDIEAGVLGKSCSSLEGAADDSLSPCINNPDVVLENWSPQDATQAMNNDEEIERAREEELEAELEKLQEQAAQEPEMGLSLSPETKAAIAARTRLVISELMSNEFRQLAMAVIQTYCAGGSFAPVLLAISGTLKFKLAEYFMSTVVDILSGIFGKRIEITPVAVPSMAQPSQTQPPLKPQVAQTSAEPKPVAEAAVPRPVAVQA